MCVASNKQPKFNQESLIGGLKPKLVAIKIICLSTQGLSGTHPSSSSLDIITIHCHIRCLSPKFHENGDLANLKICALGFNPIQTMDDGATTSSCWQLLDDALTIIEH